MCSQFTQTFTELLQSAAILHTAFLIEQEVSYSWDKCGPPVHGLLVRKRCWAVTNDKIQHRILIIEVCAMKKTNQKAGRMAQWVKRSLCNVGDLSPVPGVHVKEAGENRLHEVDL